MFSLDKSVELVDETIAININRTKNIIQEIGWYFFKWKRESSQFSFFNEFGMCPQIHVPKFTDVSFLLIKKQKILCQIIDFLANPLYDRKV